jgi:type IV pilus assembly protein PilZ
MTIKIPTLNCTFSDENSLYLAYMPFINDSGIFIRTKAIYPLGSLVNLVLQFLNDPEPYFIEGKIVWITPKGSLGNKPVGIGVQFIGDNSQLVRNKIETNIAHMLKSSQTTDTI